MASAAGTPARTVRSPDRGDTDQSD